MNKAIHKLIFLLSLTTALLTACSQEDAPVTLDNHPDTPQITVTRSTASGNSELETIFQNGTEVGLSVQENGAYTNMKYEYQNGALQATGKNIVWDKGVTSITVDAYYPYRSDGAYANPSVLEDQSSADNYYQSDALHATGTVSKTDNSMNLDFKHRTAKIILNFSEDVKDVKILNQPLTQGGEAIYTIKAYKETAQKWKACIMPGQAKLKVTGEKGNKTFNVIFYASTNFSAGNQYIYNADTWIDISSYIKINLSEESVSVSDNNSYYITQSNDGTTANNITVSSGTPTIYIHDLNISSGSAIRITGGTPTFVLVGENKLKSTKNGAPGISLEGKSANVLIKGSGKLETTGAPASQHNGGGPGIGVGSRNTGGNITIEGGIITATPADSGGWAAAIGTSGDANSDSHCGNIKISNATITMYRNGRCAAIGTGYAPTYNQLTSNLSCGTITITNSAITITNADKDDIKKNIGKGETSGSSTVNTCDKVTINNCTINGETVTKEYTP